MEMRSDGKSEADEVALMERLSDHPTESTFSNLNSRLQILDDLMSEIGYSFRLIKKYWGAKELVMMAFCVSGFILGTWDIGIGEISSGGDYDRWGIMGDESGFLHMKDLALIVSLLSLICWLGFVVMLWNSYPIMRENMLYLLIGMGFILFGFIRAHAENPDFPSEAGLGSWTWVIIANLIMLFLSTFVVRRAVVETRDIHVQRKHTHPDPRVVDRAWKDHSLFAWSSAIAAWIVFLNVSFWSSTHSVAPSPGDLDFSFSLVLIHVFTGIIATFLLLTIVWFPEFMLGATEVRIQSSRAREVSGEEVRTKKVEQGKCPVCNKNTSATMDEVGDITIPCEIEGCRGKGIVGSKCKECDSKIPTRLVCVNCGSNTPVGGHFGRVEAW
jgi:hypothetical protein|tara:strand:- start:383 stop:1537 length:1155 start_codon:yes stop_codon:yes gene_type:complete